MYRRVFQQIRHSKPFHPISRFCSASDFQYKRPHEINQVQLSGTIVHEVHRHPSNRLHFYLRTRSLDGGFSIHKVAIVNKGLINKLGRSLKIDQGIYVGGRLKSAGEKTDGVHIKESEVLANEIFFLDEYKRSVENIRFPVVCDLNLVKLLGFITSPISPGPIYKAFNISTHYKSKGLNGNEIEKADFHSVKVIRTNFSFHNMSHLEKYNRVYLEGQLDYETVELGDGEEKSVAMITPSILIKLKANRHTASTDDQSTSTSTPTSNHEQIALDVRER